MLVRFLSFAATVMGTAKYKAILLSSIALVVSLTGVFAAVTHGSSPSKTDASAFVQPASALGIQSNTSQVTKRKQPVASNQSKQTTQTTTDTPSQASSQTTDTKPATPTPTVATIMLSKSSVTLGKNQTSDSITASMSDKGQVVWSIDQSSSTNYTVTFSKNGSTDSTIQFSETATAQSSVSQVTLNAKDAAGTITTIKIDVTTL